MFGMIAILTWLGTIYFCCKDDDKSKNSKSSKLTKTPTLSNPTLYSLNNHLNKSSILTFQNSGYDPYRQVWWHKQDKIEITEID